MASSAPPPFLSNIQYLRGLAALGVLAFHAGEATGISIPRGAFGVHVFFVISGFIMVAITGDSTSPWSFLRARVERIVPPYWAATMFALLLHAATKGGRPSIPDIATSFLFLPWGEPGPGAHYFPVHAVGWTLNHEMLFYAVFALTLFLRRRLQLAVLTLAFVALWALQGAGLPFSFWGQPIVFNFIAGAWLAAYWKSGRTVWPVVAALVLLWVAGSRMLPLPAGPLLLATIVVAAGLALERGSRWRVPLFFGEASYSIYLWHAFGVWLVPIEGPLGFALAIAAGVAFGLLGYFFVEQPIRAWFRRRRQGAAALSPS
jgi:exopolysaccharide production protein ExoZ